MIRKRMQKPYRVQQVKFVSVQAKLKFNKIVEINNFFFVKQGLYFEGITYIISALEWRWFVKELTATVESIVRKFYVNVSDVVDNKVRIRSVLV